MKINYPKELHNLLIRQLNKFNLDYALPPSNGEEWKTFLRCISNSYSDSDQDRYLIERSLEISSHELSDVNKKLENAQSLARVGYWVHDLVSNKISWSKEMYVLFGYQMTEGEPGYEEITEMIHPDDRIKFEETRNNSLTYCKDYEMELRFMHKPTKQYRWFNVIGHPSRPTAPEEKVLQLSGTAMDITRRKEVEEKIAKMNQQLFVSAARAERMAEVATSILHNVGNTLNSVNVSLGLVHETIQESKLNKLEVLSNMLQEHLSTLSEYFTTDPKGKLVPNYLVTLSKTATMEYKLISDEIKSIEKHIQYIKQIVTTQQSMTVTSGATEQNSVNDLLETALEMSNGFSEEDNIIINKHFGPEYFITADTSKVLLILVNLIKNAKEALQEVNQSSKEIILSVKLLSDNQINIIIKDNGMGVTPENLARIFSFGFTTKSRGHGFGLHSSALAASELGGSLHVESDGLGKGSTFTLTLPLNPIR